MCIRTTVLLFRPTSMSTAQLAAVSYLARYAGPTRTPCMDETITSLYAGGMTVGDIQHHLARTVGTDLSHETISKITDAVLDEVTAWQSRPLEEL